MEILYGVHPVEEALRAGRRRIEYVCVARERRDQRLDEVIALCRSNQVRLEMDNRDKLTALARTPDHQGVVAVVRAQRAYELDDILDGPVVPGTPRLMLGLDGVEDPQNLGALLRCADGAGVDGVVLTERRSAPLSAVAVKTSAGASEHLRITRVVNLVRALEAAKQKNMWVVGLDERGTEDYDRFDLTGDIVLVLGREGAGLHDLTRRTCDYLLKIPMAGRVSSLNVAAAGAVVLYEAARQRRNKLRGQAPAGGPVRPKKLKGLGS